MIDRVEFGKRIDSSSKGLLEKEELTIMEIGLDEIDSASSFVSYISEEYKLPKSSVWYNLKKLKELGLLDFANKDEKGKKLSLTKSGVYMYHHIKDEKTDIMAKFYNKIMKADDEYTYNPMYNHIKVNH